MKKNLILVLSLMGCIDNAVPCSIAGPKSLNDIRAIEAFLKPRLAPKAVPAKLLAPEIKRLSKLYGVPSMLIARVILVESRGIEGAVNHRTNDYGLGQINAVHNIAFFCLMDWKCNLEQSVRILAKRGLKYNGSNVATYKAKLEAI